MALFGAGTFFYLQKPNQPDQTAAQHYDRASHEAEDWFARVKEQGKGAPCDQGESAPKCSEQYATALDLSAQWAAANAGRRLVWLTEIQTGIAVAGLVGLVITSAMTIATFLTTSRTSRAQLRAYVLVDQNNFNFAPNQIPTMHVEIKNFGQTPAYKLTGWSVYGFHSLPMTGEMPKQTEEVGTSTTIGPSARFLIPVKFDKPLNRETWNAIRQGTHAVFVVGGVNYTDAFGIERETKFCMFTGGSVGTGSNFGFSPYIDGNEST